MIMSKTNRVVSRGVPSQHPPLLLRCRSIMLCCALILIMLLRCHGVAGGSGTTVTAGASAPPTIHRLDLSYLHRCGVGELANAIRGTLEQQLRKEAEQHLESNEHQAEEVVGEAAGIVLDIDLTASLIGKNISEILASMKQKQSEQDHLQAEVSEPALPMPLEPLASRIVRLTARRNRLSPGEAVSVLEFVLENGPTNETITTPTVTTDGNETETAATRSDEESDASPEKSVIADEDEIETNGNITTIADGSTTANLDSDSNDNDAREDGEDAGIESASIAAAATKIITMRPAFVSIQSLDLGWNNLGSSSKRSAGVRTVNRALRNLLADPQRCPPTIRLDVCGLGPQACRDLAKGIVERYQTEDGKINGKINGNALPPPLSLDLACNEGIGDVGVAALAAAIRTVAPRDGLININKKKEAKPKQRRRKKKRSKQEPFQEEEKTKTEEEKKEEGITEPKIIHAIEAEPKSGDPEAAVAVTEAVVEVEVEVEGPRIILDRLDLSGCGIGDVGAEALAIALTNHPLCIRHLDLSNNRISDQGATALARALGTRDFDGTEEDENESQHPTTTSTSAAFGFVETLDLSHNKDLGNAGATELAHAFRGDGISRLILRSCNVRADGAASFGTILRSFGKRTTASLANALTKGQESQGQSSRLIDLSGNPLGILSKTKKSGSKYSATALRSKASDTTKAYMNIIGKSFQKGLNSINGGPDTLESDDEEEDRMEDNEDEDSSRIKCGALSLAEGFVRDGSEDITESSTPTDASVHVELGLRHCSFDTRAAEALAAVLQESRQKYPGMKLTMDMTMNHVLEDDMIAALHGEEGCDDQLADMAEVYLDALEVMREARERAVKAARMAALRAKALSERESTWGGTPSQGSRHNYNDDEDYGGVWSGDSDGVDDEDDGRWGDDDDDDSSVDDSARMMEEDYSDEDW